MKSLDALFEIKDAYCDTEPCREIFFKAMKEAFAYHFERSSVYREICKNEGFTPMDLTDESKLSKIPHIMVNAFKWHTFKSIQEEEIAYEFTSSGTSGQKSHILWDEGSHQRQGLMRERMMETLGLISRVPVNYLIFAYAPEVSESKGAAYANQMYATFAPAKGKAFAIRPDARGLPFFDVDSVVKVLGGYERERIPVRMIGFPAFIHETMLHLKERGLTLRLPKESLVITAGGWKDKEDKKIPLEEFRRELKETFGIGEDRLRDVYGFVEHGVPYITCAKGHFHVPVYARAFARKPGTLERLGYGEKGLLHVISPYNLAQPALSILSTDYVVIQKDCGCGITTDYLELMGRAGVKKHQGCAITATELLTR